MLASRSDTQAIFFNDVMSTGRTVNEARASCGGTKQRRLLPLDAVASDGAPRLRRRTGGSEIARGLPAETAENKFGNDGTADSFCTVNCVCALQTIKRTSARLLTASCVCCRARLLLRPASRTLDVAKEWPQSWSVQASPQRCNAAPSQPRVVVTPAPSHSMAAGILSGANAAKVPQSVNMCGAERNRMP